MKPTIFVGMIDDCDDCDDCDDWLYAKQGKLS